jgi:hypothetical protein
MGGELMGNKTREEALVVCCYNYEMAMKLSRIKVARLETDLRRVSAEHAKLIKVVVNNTKNYETILKQAGVVYES